MDEQSAKAFLSRALLYNSWDLELVVPDNLERECREEICTYEEAREVFEEDTQTVTPPIGCCGGQRSPDIVRFVCGSPIGLDR